MTVTTVFSTSADGRISSTNPTYANARSGAGGATLNADTGTFGSVSDGVGQTGPSYACYEGFLQFDTSGIADTDVVSAATLSVYGSSDNSTTDFTIEARFHNWGATLTTADYIAGASLSADTRLATFATSGWSTSGYNAFTEDGTNFQTNVSLTGTTYVVLSSSRVSANTTPTGAEYVGFYVSEQTGTTNDPKLVVTSAPAPTTAYKDTATRFKLVVLSYKDAATRFRLSILNYKDTATRFRLSLTSYKDAATRFRLRLTAYRDAATRFRLRVLSYKDAATRFALSISSYKDVATRFSLVASSLSYKDVATRFRLAVLNYRDTATRFKLGVLNYKDAATRFRLRLTSYRDVATRFSLRIRTNKDVATRFALALPVAGTARRGWWWWGYTHDERYG